MPPASHCSWCGQPYPCLLTAGHLATPLLLLCRTTSSSSKFPDIVKCHWCVCVGGDQIQLRIDCKVRYIGYLEKESFLTKRSKFSSKIPILVMAKLLLILCAPMCVPWGLKPSYAHAIDAKHMPYHSICSPLAFLTGTLPLHPSGLIRTPDIDFQWNKDTSTHTQPAFLQYFLFHSEE